MINPIPVNPLQIRANPAANIDTDSSSGSQFDTHWTGIGLNIMCYL